jgi:hypothetical protein
VYEDVRTGIRAGVCESCPSAVALKPLSGDVVPFVQLQRRVLRDRREVLVDREEFVGADERTCGDKAVDP